MLASSDPTALARELADAFPGRVSKPERETQNRVIALLEGLGYTYLGDWTPRAANANIERELLLASLRGRGVEASLAAQAVERLSRVATAQGSSAYEINESVYGLLRYGVTITPGAGQRPRTVPLIDWANPLANDFAVAEEVTLYGDPTAGIHTRRPDLVLYVNGIAVGVIELKSARVQVGEGIRQLISLQDTRFAASFFPTIQFCMAGNDTQGLRYGTLGTPQAFFLGWKEGEHDPNTYRLDRDITATCSHERLIELMRDFVVFDGGVKKLPRHNQFFGVKAAQGKLRTGEGGIIWHTQGSGKSLTMVMLARWVLENLSGSRVVVITDRDELDKQIMGVFEASGERPQRATSGRDLLEKLATPSPRLICSLIHKFGRRDVDDLERYLNELDRGPAPSHGKLFVFVDEAHRTQSGTLHRLMKAQMPGAVFVGFTGTPLLAEDRATSRETFGEYIHTYLHPEAVRDEVVLDLVYEARDVDQRLTSDRAIDRWFEAKTANLNDWQRNELASRWATLKRVLSSRGRRSEIVADILLDFSTKPRLKSERGNAMLVAGSIYEAAKYFVEFEEGGLKDRVGIVTSYEPHVSDLTKEDVGASKQSELQFVHDTYTRLLANEPTASGKGSAEAYEDRVKRLFQTQPARMKLLVVVDKLLTGFDAPPCTYLYIDKPMRDHGLFQAICRTNRLDGADKDFGHVVDYRDLFKNLEKAVAVYASELSHDGVPEGEDPQIKLQRRVDAARETFDDAREAWFALREDVPPPRTDLTFIAHFCGNPLREGDLEERQGARTTLYFTVAAFARAFANLSQDPAAAGLDEAAIAVRKAEVQEAANARMVVRTAAGEEIDLKPYEADMRHLIDTYISADPPRPLSALDEVPLVDLIVKSGIAEAIRKKLGRSVRDAGVAEVIENNVRSALVRHQLTDPAFYERMSALLAEVVALRSEQASDYEDYLRRIAALAREVCQGTSDGTPPSINTAERRALFGMIQDEEMTLRVDNALREACPNDFMANVARRNQAMRVLVDVLGDVAVAEQVLAVAANHSVYS